MSRLPLLLALAIPAFAQQQSLPHNLAGMRDHYRPLLIFEPTDNSGMQKQLDLLTPNRSALIDRQIMLVPITTLWLGLMDHEIMNHVSDQRLWERFHIHPTQFTVILLGKDGTEKFRSHTPVTIDQLTRLIDAMPMRQQEMRSPPQH